MWIPIHCPNTSCRVATNVGVAERGVKCKTCGTWIANVTTLDGLPFPTLPTEFGRYHILSLLGRGGMGAVYLAEDTQLGRKVALKLPSFDASESKRLERFVREAKASAGLLHPNICPVFDAGSIAGRPYISMAYINGKSLEDEIDPDRPMDGKRAVEIVRKIAAALQDAHENNIVHRDLKPANVIMSTKGEPIVMDFGLALRVNDYEENETKLTKLGEVMGTPRYMSPEQVRGDIEKIGPATDIYALGVMLFELLTGHPPYGGQMIAVMAQILSSPVPPLREFRPDADSRLEAICQQAMAKDIAARPASMAIFAAQLGEYQRMADGKPAVVMFAPAARKPSKPSTPFGNFDDTSAKKRPREARTTYAGPTQTRSSRTPHEAKPVRWPMIAGFAVLCALLGMAGFLLSERTKTGDVEGKRETTSEVAKRQTPIPTKVQAKSTAIPAGAGTILPKPIPTKWTANNSTLKGGEELSLEISDGVMMVFCWIPPGQVTLGSPLTEKNRDKNEAEHEYATDGFWLGKYECTQKEWTAVMGVNPSWFSATGGGKDRVLGLDKGRLPVEQVNWDDAQNFLKMLNARGSVAIGRLGKFKLPHEDQWEYACRGGNGNLRAFYWGDALNGDMANVNGNYPYGTEVKGNFLERTAYVGSSPKSAIHPWNLCDMSGNVSEWCDNLYDNAFNTGQNGHAIRGGAWRSLSWNCRAASRDGIASLVRAHFLGFRVCFSPPS